MCYECWEEYGKPHKVDGRIVAAARSVDRVYEFSCVGGNLHVLVDDWNVETEFLEGCRAWMIHNASNCSAEQIAAETECLDLMEPMTEAERATVLALRAGYIDENGEER